MATTEERLAAARAKALDDLNIAQSSPTKGSERTWGDTFADLLSGAKNIGSDMVEGGVASVYGIQKALTFGMDDNLSAGFEKLLSPVTGDTRDYEQMRSDARAYSDDQMADAPVAGFGGELLGSLLGGTGVAKASANVAAEFAPAALKYVTSSFGKRLLTAGVTAGAENAVYGLDKDTSASAAVTNFLTGAAFGAGAQGVFGELLPYAVNRASTTATPRTNYEAALEIKRYLSQSADTKMLADGFDPAEVALRASQLPKGSTLTEVYPELQDLIASTGKNFSGRDELMPLLNSLRKRELLAGEAYQSAIDEVLQVPTLRGRPEVQRDATAALKELTPMYDDALDNMTVAGIHYSKDDVLTALGSPFKNTKGENLMTSSESAIYTHMQSVLKRVLKGKKVPVVMPREMQAVLKRELDDIIASRGIQSPVDGKSSTALSRSAVMKAVEARNNLKAMLHFDSDEITKTLVPDASGAKSMSLKDLDFQYGDELAVDRAHKAGTQLFTPAGKAIDATDIDLFMHDTTSSVAETRAFVEGVKLSMAEVVEKADSVNMIRKKLTQNTTVQNKLMQVLGPDATQKLMQTAELYIQAAQAAKRSITTAPGKPGAGKNGLGKLIDAGLILLGTGTNAVSGGLAATALRRQASSIAAPHDSAVTQSIADLLLAGNQGADIGSTMINNILKNGMTDANIANTVKGAGVGFALSGQKE